MIKRGFVLAAGKGERMRPLTETRPKPLIEVGGRTMLDRALDALKAAGVEEAVVNTHYLGHMIHDHLRDYQGMKIILSPEEKLLETGGGIRHALHHFKGEPFFVLNGDAFWADGQIPALKRLGDMWNDDKMDLLLLLHAMKDIPCYGGKADYYLEAGANKPLFAKGEKKYPEAHHVFGGTRIVHPRLFEGSQEGFYSFLDFMLQAERQDRLYALEHDGPWYHVGTPQELEEVNKRLAAGE
jgi:MurNAc alpha-1-phosphate uridylyltransferase